MARDTNLAVVGAGLIGRRHCAAIAMADGVSLSALVDPAPEASGVASALGVPWFRSLPELIAAGAAEGVILATPNTLHAEGTEACVEAGLPVLVEKPIFTDLGVGLAILDRAEVRGVPVAVGHHRRHNPLIKRARQAIEEGDLGRIVAVQATAWFMKPETYFEVDWRREKGAGPVYLNLIHDIELLLHLCGPICDVRAVESNAVRGNDVEETAVVLLTFENGALGTISASDTVVAPWSWELTARENPAYPATAETCYWIGGTHGSLSLPNLSLWTNPGERSWWEPISETKLTFGFDDPLVLQAAQFGRVVRDEEAPLVPGRDGLAALTVIEAIKRAAASGETIRPATLLQEAKG
ncbi:Gfo/Idh/MocA family oxidoreductase [Fulvimarina sp. MAC8]|uniref:Gfo/Idh/MocA family protein n=1 Tax=Fulvimarina sp. MAC8 TaxID=3162874 RepID=UPI0032EEB45D